VKEDWEAVRWNMGRFTGMRIAKFQNL